MQVHYCSPGELRDFYLTNPSAVAREFYDQVVTFVSRGYASGFILTPELAEIGYDTGLILANSPHAQMQWHRQFGHDAIDADNWLEDILHLQIEHYKPEILLLTGDIDLSPGFFHTTLYRPECIVAWPYAVIPETLPWSDFDLVLSGISGVRSKATQLGASSTATFYPGFRSDLFKQIEAIKPTRDVGFFGAWSSDRHHKRNFFLTQMGAVAIELEGQLRVEFFLDADTDDLPYEVKVFRKSARYGIEALKTICSSWTVFDLKGISGISSGGSPVDLSGLENANPRLFEVTGCGSLLLTERSDNLSDLFLPGKEVVAFDDLEDLHEKMAYYLKHHDELSEIALAGMHRCHRDHNMTQRALQFDALVADHFAQAGVSFEPAAQSYSQTAMHLPASGLLGEASAAYLMLLQSIEQLHSGQPDTAIALADRFVSRTDTPGPHELAALTRAIAMQRLGAHTEALAFLHDLPDHLKSSSFIQSGIRTIEQEPPVPASTPAPPDETTGLLTPADFAHKPIPPLEVEERTLASINSQINKALKALDKGDGKKALSCIATAKAHHAPTRDLDYTRALCFLKLDRMREATLALREELVYFPDNAAAAELLEQLTRMAPPVFSAEQKEDSEFVEYIKELGPYSFLSQDALYSLYRLARQICRDGIPGNFVECGVGLGGSALMLAAVAKRFAGLPRTVYACDSFSGLPAPGKKDRYCDVPANETGWGEGAFLTPAAFIENTAISYGLHTTIVPVEVNLAESLDDRSAEIGGIALLHLDCCLYDSTLSSLEVLYQQLSEAGQVVIQGYNSWSGVTRAVDKFIAKQKIDIDSSAGDVVCFKKKK